MGFISGSERFSRELVEGLRDLGYEEGRHYELLPRYYGSDRSRIERLADDLMRARPDVIVANVSSTAAIVKRRTATVPIVMATAIDPVAEGLAESLVRPGGNVTGLTSLSQALHAKVVEFTHLLLPKAKRAGFVVNPDHILAGSHRDVAGRAARDLGMHIVPFEVRALRDVDLLAEQITKHQVDAVVVSADAALFAMRERLVGAALAAGVPTVGVLPEFADAGALASYGHDVAANFRATARYVDRILKGANPAEMPIEQPTQFVLALNLKAARALRIAIPQAVLLRADRVVE